MLRRRLAILQSLFWRRRTIRIAGDDCWRFLTDGLSATDGERGWRLTIPQRDVVGRWSDKTRMFSWNEPDLWESSRGAWDPGDVFEAFERRVYQTLGVEARRLRLCLECRKAFVANGRQQYCRQGCSQTRRTRDYRLRHPAKVKQRRKGAYARKQREKFPNARVGRPPRPTSPTLLPQQR